MGKGAIDETYDLYLGMIGSYGNRCANMGIANVDLLIVLGARLDTRQTGAKFESFIPNAHIIHVDIDNNELEHHQLKNRIKVNCKIDKFLSLLNLEIIKFKNYTRWNNYLCHLKAEYNQDKEIERFVENKSPYRFIQYLNNITRENDVICVDIGQNQMWTAQTLTLKSNQRFVTSGGLAPMGFSLPAAIGTSFAAPDKTIYSINGDGGFHIAIQSLLLISQYNLPIKVIILNNNSLGMITQFQHLYFNDRMVATTKKGGYSVPNIKDLAKAYGLSYYELTEESLNDNVLLEQIEKSRNCIIEYLIIGQTTVSPKLEFNKPISKPMPFLPDEEYLSSMLVNE
jgi:acetolactate synthase-1/2/3 large subunit